MEDYCFEIFTNFAIVNALLCRNGRLILLNIRLRW